MKEREDFLQSFREGTYSILVTSKVLNEGVDVPEANVAIVVSGSGSVREHVQRLGRILRGRPGKQAYLYELVSKRTGEHYVNERRRRHRAYQNNNQSSPLRPAARLRFLLEVGLFIDSHSFSKGGVEYASLHVTSIRDFIFEIFKIYELFLKNS